MRILKGFLLLSLVFMGISGAWAQTAQIKGTVVEDGTEKPIQFALISLNPGNYETASGPDGVFILTDIPAGTYTMEIISNGYQKYSFEVTAKGENIDLNNISTKKDATPSVQNSDDLVPVVTTGDDESAGSTSSGDNNISGVLSASRDVYVSTASFNFGQARFRTRGYDPDNFAVLINGVPMNDLETGDVYWSSWGGLNDVFRFRDNSYGLELNTFSFGETGGATNMDIIAARQRKQLSLSYAVGNRSYKHRLMATYSTGVMKGGWAVSGSFSWRAAGEGYVPGTFYDSKAYYLGVSKKFGTKHILSFTTFGTPTRRGKMAPAIQEMYDLADDPFYNPNWGYQNGKKRNSRVFESFQPVFMLNHEFKIDKKSSLNTTAAFQFGETSNSAIDWFYGQNPSPDYYRNLPSFQTDSVLAQQVRDAILDDPNLIQLNWDKMYQTNYNNIETVYNINGTGDSITGRRSNYVLGERVQAMKDFAFNTTFNHTFSDHVSLAAGAIYQMQMTESFNRVGDLLGGDFYVDLNRFAQIGLPLDSNLLQNDLDNPNRIVREGDKYGTMFRFTQHKVQAWAQAQFNFKKVDFFIAGRISVSSFWRTGLTRVGLFPDNSLGRSEQMLFVNPGVKGGITYKINGRHYVYANGGYSTRAPYVNNVFLSPRTRNSINDNLVSEKIISGEAGYIWNSPRVRVKATGYYTLFLDGIENKSFFHDDYNAFVNMSLSNLDRRHYGGEFGVEGKIYKGFAINAVMGIGRSQWIDRPIVTLTQDNSAEVLLDNQTVYLKNFNVASGPQWANTIGLSYNAPQGWFARLNFNYFDWIFVEVNPIRRTTAAVEGMDRDSEQYQQTVDQERLPGQFTMDFFGGYTWNIGRTFKTKKPMQLVFSLSVNNLTNNRKFISSGFEQLRFDFDEKNPNKFPPKYFYNFGANAFFNVAFRMQ